MPYGGTISNPGTPGQLVPVDWLRGQQTKLQNHLLVQIDLDWGAAHRHYSSVDSSAGFQV
jgi:hypothetical protein